MPIILSQERKNTAVPLKINAQPFGEGVFMVRPYLFDERYEKKTDKLQQQIIEITAQQIAAENALEEFESEPLDREDEERHSQLKAEVRELEKKNKDAIAEQAEHFMSLIADWDLFAEPRLS